MVPQLKHKWVVSLGPAVQGAEDCPGLHPKPPTLNSGVQDGREKDGTLKIFFAMQILMNTIMLLLKP